MLSWSFLRYTKVEVACSFQILLSLLNQMMKNDNATWHQFADWVFFGGSGMKVLVEVV